MLSKEYTVTAIAYIFEVLGLGISNFSSDVIPVFVGVRIEVAADLCVNTIVFHSVSLARLPGYVAICQFINDAVR